MARRNQIIVVSLGENKRNLRFEKISQNTAFFLLKALRRSGVYLEIYLAGASKMLALNKKFRGKNKAADVLSFNEPKGFISGPGQKPLGEVFLNINEFKNHNRAVFLLIHGILHLLGYDHIKKNDRIKMEAKEKQLLNRLLV